MTVSPGYLARRKFDHDDAQRRHAAGEKIAALAREYGVSWTAVARVVDPELRQKMATHCTANLERRRTPCLGGCGARVWIHHAGHSGYCPKCLGEKRRAENGPQHGTVNEYRLGCRCGECRRASNEARRDRRIRARATA